MGAHEHVVPEMLLDYLEQRLDEATTARVRAHLETRCVCCGTELAFWTRLLAALRQQAVEARGNLVLLRCPLEWKSQLPVWGH